MVACKCGRMYNPKVPGHIRCMCGETIIDENFKISPMEYKRHDISEVVYKAEEGRKHWLKLHNYAKSNKSSWSSQSAKEFYKQWEKDIPNIGCGCRKNWFELKKTINFSTQFDSAESFFQWSVEAHNAVNKKLNKSIVSYEEACQIHGF